MLSYSIHSILGRKICSEDLSSKVGKEVHDDPLRHPLQLSVHHKASLKKIIKCTD